VNNKDEILFAVLAVNNAAIVTFGFRIKDAVQHYKRFEAFDRPIKQNNFINWLKNMYSIYCSLMTGITLQQKSAITCAPNEVNRSVV